MSTYIKEKVAHGDSSVEIRIEVDETGPEEQKTPWKPYSYGSLRGGESKSPEDPSLPERTFEKGMALIRTCAEQVADTMHQIDKAVSPSEVEVKFGVKMTGEAGALIAKKGAEAHMEVTLKWNSTKTPAPNPDNATKNSPSHPS